jgi:CubicO group peptidase (beta-lactamase class C family)
LLIGIAIDDGLIGSVDDPVAKYLEEFEKDGREKITIRDLLTMSSGLDWDESGSSPMSDNAEAYYGWDLRGQMFGIKPKMNPGEVFEYASCNTQFLGFILSKVTQMSVAEYLEQKIWRPIGMEQEALWNLDDKDGDEKAFCCLYATARDFLRIGRLMLHNGNWNGSQIVSEDWVQQSVTPAKLLNEKKEPNVVYGQSWWIDVYKGTPFYYARGILGQYIICIPAYDLVIFRAGHQRGEKTDSDHPEDIYWYIEAALAMLPS